MKPFIVISILLFGFSSNLISQQDIGSGWQLLGQVMLRTEIDGRDFSNSTHPLSFASSRIRFAVSKSFEERLQLFIQLQDSRIFGSEANTLANSKNLDIHQGYVRLNKLFDWDFEVQAGRFELAYGTERFFGAVGWHYVGRSFDGVKFTIGPGSLDLDLFALTINESLSYIGNAAPQSYSYPLEPTPSSSIYGVWKKNNFDESGKFDVFGYWEIDREKVGIDTCRLNKVTAGGTYWGNFGSFNTIIEGAYQFGKQAGSNVSAFLFSAQGQYQTSIISLGLGADFLSGTKQSESSKVNTFYPSYGTNHKFYGYMDYFINVPNNSLNLGLNDYYFKGKISPVESKWEFALDIHHFMSNQKYIYKPDESSTEVNTFGQEIDLTVSYNFLKGTKLFWGGGLFFPGSLMKQIFNPRGDTAYWTYLMVLANL